MWGVERGAEGDTDFSGLSDCHPVTWASGEGSLCRERMRGLYLYTRILVSLAFESRYNM